MNVSVDGLMVVKVGNKHGIRVYQTSMVWGYKHYAYFKKKKKGKKIET